MSRHGSPRIGIAWLLAAFLVGCGGVEGQGGLSLRFTGDGTHVWALDATAPAVIELTQAGVVARYRPAAAPLAAAASSRGWWLLLHEEGSYRLVGVGTTRQAYELPQPVNEILVVADDDLLLRWNPEGPEVGGALVRTGEPLWLHGERLYPLTVEQTITAAGVGTATDGTAVLVLVAGAWLYLFPAQGTTTTRWRLELGPSQQAPRWWRIAGSRLLLLYPNRAELYQVELPTAAAPPRINVLPLTGVPDDIIWDDASAEVVLVWGGLTTASRSRFAADAAAVPTPEPLPVPLLNPRVSALAGGTLYWSEAERTLLWEAATDPGSYVQLDLERPPSRILAGPTARRAFVFERDGTHLGVLVDPAAVTLVPLDLASGAVAAGEPLPWIAGRWLLPLDTGRGWLELLLDHGEVRLVELTEAEIASWWSDGLPGDRVLPLELFGDATGYFAVLSRSRRGGVGLWVREGRPGALVEGIAFSGILDESEVLP